MNKKMILALTLVLVLGVGAGMGTMALYSKQFETEGNQVAAATFKPGLDSSQVLTGGQFYPGKTQTITLKYDNRKSQVATEFAVNKETLTATIDGEEYKALIVDAPEAVEVPAKGIKKANLTVKWRKNSKVGNRIEEGKSLSNDALKAGKKLKVSVDVIATQSN